jgi:hypothetical protein
MKNAFVLSSPILAAAFSAAVAAATFGIVSFRLPSLSAVIGTYAALGVLAFAFRDYTRHARLDARSSLQRSPRAGTRAAVHPLSLPHSTLQAN